MAMLYQTTGWKRLLGVSETSNTVAPAASQTAEPVNLIRTFGYQSLRMKFIGDTIDDSYTVALYGVEEIGAANAGTTEGYYSTLFGTVTVTIADVPKTGVQGHRTAVPADLYADELSWAENEYGTDLLAQVGGRVTVFPTTPDDRIAQLMISDTSNLLGFSVVFGALSSESGNMIYKLDVL